MSSVDKLIFLLYRGCAHTKYAIDAVPLQSIARHKAEQLGGSLQFLCRYWTMTDDQGEKATIAVSLYNDQMAALLPNLSPNREKIAQVITETLARVDELCADIVASPDRPEPQDAPPISVRRPGRPKKEALTN